MDTTLLLHATALAALVPAALLALRRPARRDAVYWSALLVALAGPAVWVWSRQAAGWHTGLATSLWLTVVACMVLHVVVALLSEQGWRLTPLLAPYLLLLGILASIWSHAPEQPLTGGAPLAWIGTHIAVSVTTYGLITLAAVAALAAWLQERALRDKRETGLTRLLPSVADAEALTIRLLAAGEIVLAAGLATGMATLYNETGRIFVVDHKTLLTSAVFVVVGVLLWAHFHSGVRGKAAARGVLLAYLLFTLGYPGVKFVTDILLA